jgi:opacity protein-like surface antigen
MKKLLLISTAFAALIAPTIAAAKPLRVYKRPVPVAAPVSTWTGFYVGANVGGSWSNVRTNIAGSASTVALPGAGGDFQAITLPLPIQTRHGQMASSAGVRSATTINSARDGCWASRPTFRARVNGKAMRSPIRSQRRFAPLQSPALPPAVSPPLARSMPQRRRLMTPRSAGLGGSRASWFFDKQSGFALWDRRLGLWSG